MNRQGRVVKSLGTFRRDDVARRAAAPLKRKFLRLPVIMPMMLWLVVRRVDDEMSVPLLAMIKEKQGVRSLLDVQGFSRWIV